MLFLIVASFIYTCVTIQPQIFTYKTIDNLNIEAGVYVPQVIPEDKFPVIFIIHGGGYLAGSSSTAFSERELDEMLVRSWVVVSIDYRLGPYYLLPDIVEDVVDAYNWVRSDLVKTIPINPDAIAIWGGSAGSGLAAIAGYKVTPRPKAIIAFYPYCTDFTDSYTYNPDTPVSAELVAQANALRQPITNTATLQDWETRWSLLSRGLEEQKIGWLLVTSNPDESKDTVLKILREYSVVYHIDTDYPPTYLIHGQLDSIVPTSESTQMAEVLRRQNVPYQIDLVPGFDHAFDLFPISEEVWQQHLIPIFDFVEKYIAPTSTLSTGPANLFIEIIIAIVLIIFVIAGIFFIRARKYARLKDSLDQ